MSFLKRKKPKVNLVERKKPKIASSDGLQKDNEMVRLDTPKENIVIVNKKKPKTDDISLKTSDLLEEQNEGDSVFVQHAECEKKFLIIEENEKGNAKDDEEAEDDDDEDDDEDEEEDSNDGLPRLGDLLGTNKRSPDYINDMDIENLYGHSFNMCNDDTQLEMISNEDKKLELETLGTSANVKSKEKARKSSKFIEISAKDDIIVDKKSKTNDEASTSGLNKFANNTKADKLLSLSNDTIHTLDTLGKSVESPKSLLIFNKHEVNESNNTEVEQEMINSQTKNAVASRSFTNSNLENSLLTDINQTSQESAYLNNEILNIDSTRKNNEATSDIANDFDLGKIDNQLQQQQRSKDGNGMIIEEDKVEEGAVSSSLDPLENIYGKNIPINNDELPAALLTNPIKLTINEKGDIVEETSLQSSFQQAEMSNNQTASFLDNTEMEVDNEAENRSLTKHEENKIIISKEQLSKALGRLGPEMTVIQKTAKKKKLIKKKTGAKSKSVLSKVSKEKAKVSDTGSVEEKINEQVEQEEGQTTNTVDKNILFPTQFTLEPQVIKSPTPNGPADVVIQPVFNITERPKPPDYTALTETSSIFCNPIETQDASLPSEFLTSDSTANDSNIQTLQSCGHIGEEELVRGFQGKLASGVYHMQKVKEDIYSIRRVNDIQENTARRQTPSPRNDASAASSSRAGHGSRSVPNACAGQPVDITNILLEDNNCFEISNNRVEIYTPNEPLGRLNSRRRNIIVEERPRATSFACMGPTASVGPQSVYQMPRNRPVMVTRATQTPIHMSIPTSTPRSSSSTIPIYSQSHVQNQPFFQMPIVNTTISTRTWSTPETFRFYDCVRVFKTDFRAIARLFPDRDLEQIILKFRMENHHNADLISILLTNMENVDIRSLITEPQPTTSHRQFVFEPMNYGNQEVVYGFDDNQTITITDNSPPNIETLCAIPLTTAQEQSLRRIIKLNQILHRTYAQYNKNSNIRINPNKEIISEVLNLCVKGLNDGYLVVGKELCSKTGNSFEVFTRNRVSGKIAGSLKLCSFLVVAIVGLMNL